MKLQNNRTHHYIIVILVTCASLSYAQSPIPSSALLEKLRTGFLQPEGPVWKDGVGLLFSDIRANKIYKWSPADSSLTTYLQHSDSSNGLTFDLQGRLILTQMELRRVARQELDGTITPLASTYNGKKFNSPNDVVVKSDGSIFFTDPDFNIPTGQQKELPYKGVYRISPTGVVQLLDSVFDKPNGICFSPHETKLYVNESPQCKIYVWDVLNDSSITNKRLFYTIPENIATYPYADGMKVDTSGNLFCTCKTGIWIISPTGTGLGKIAMTETPSNCAWGDADRKTLYITAGSSLYRIRTVTTGVERGHGTNMPSKINLYQNYPNPFNPETTITYTLASTGDVDLKVFDMSGKEIAALVHTTQSAGNHNATWNAEGTASGVYFARLTLTEGQVQVQTRKMMFVK